MFQCLVNDVLKEFLGKCAIVSSDDILIYSPDSSSHLANQKEVLQRLLELYVKPEKCEFEGLDQIVFGLHHK